jgi:hypothetical protein
MGDCGPSEGPTSGVPYFTRGKAVDGMVFFRLSNRTISFPLYYYRCIHSGIHLHYERWHTTMWASLFPFRKIYQIIFFFLASKSGSIVLTLPANSRGSVFESLANMSIGIVRQVLRKKYIYIYILSLHDLPFVFSFDERFWPGLSNEVGDDVRHRHQLGHHRLPHELYRRRWWLVHDRSTALVLFEEIDFFFSDSAISEPLLVSFLEPRHVRDEIPNWPQHRHDHHLHWHSHCRCRRGEWCMGRMGGRLLRRHHRYLVLDTRAIWGF